MKEVKKSFLPNARYLTGLQSKDHLCLQLAFNSDPEASSQSVASYMANIATS